MKCEICNNEITGKPNKKYCSIRCNNESKRLKNQANLIQKGNIKVIEIEGVKYFKCEYCDKIHDGKLGSGRFCSMKCTASVSFIQKRKSKLSILSNESVTILNNDTLDFVIRKECPTCEKEFKTRKDNAVYCSRKCVKFTPERNAQLSKIKREGFSSGKYFPSGGWGKIYEILTSNGVLKLRSNFEVRAVRILDSMLRDGFIDSWEHLPCSIQYKNVEGKNCSYFPDFSMTKNGKKIIIEVKGFMTSNDKLKWEATEKLYEYEVWYKNEIEILEKTWK